MSQSGIIYPLSVTGEGGWGTGGTIATLTGPGNIFLADNTLAIVDGTNNMFYLNPATDNKTAYIRAINGNFFNGKVADLNVSATDVLAQFTLRADFNTFSGPNASITGYSDATNNTLTYNADTHTFTGNVVIGDKFIVTDGVNDLLLVDQTSFASRLSANDFTAFSSLNIFSDLVGGSVVFDLISNDGVNQVEITGDAIAQTITLTAANGIIFPEFAGGGTQTLGVDNNGRLVIIP